MRMVLGRGCGGGTLAVAATFSCIGGVPVSTLLLVPSSSTEKVKLACGNCWPEAYDGGVYFRRPGLMSATVMRSPGATATSVVPLLRTNDPAPVVWPMRIATKLFGGLSFGSLKLKSL